MTCRRVCLLALLVTGVTSCRHEAPSADAPRSAQPKPGSVSTSGPGMGPSSAQGSPTQESGRSRCSLFGPSAPAPATLFPSARQLRSRTELDALVAKGAGAAPERIAIRVEGTFGAGCECPPFSAWFSDPDESFSPIIAIPQRGVADIRSRLGLHFIVVGYFSGARIDTYEYFRVVGVDPGKPDEEQRSAWPEQYPEFCLEALCYAAPLLRPGSNDSSADAASKKFLQGVSAQHAAELVRRGVAKCNREWVPDS